MSAARCRLPQVSRVTAPRANHESRLVHQYDEEYEEIKKARRPGRPASTREDLLRMKIATLEKEHRDGFCKLFQFSSTNHIR